MEKKEESKTTEFVLGTINNFKNPSIVHAEFNQDQTCFIYTFNNEMCVWDCKNLQVRYTRVFKKNLGQATALYKTNIVVLCNKQGVQDPLIADNTACVWDDHQKKFIAELNFKDDVVSVKVLRKYIIIVLKTSIYVYELSNLSVLKLFETQVNIDGLCAIADGEMDSVPGAMTMKPPAEVTETNRHLFPADKQTIMAFPGKETGMVSIYHLNSDKQLNIQAHKSELSGMALNRNGTLLATVSEKGTLIRVFDTTTGEMKFEFRRGTTATKINNLSFNTDSDLLCATSYKGNGVGGTIHIYVLDESRQNKLYLKTLGFSGLDYSDAKIYLTQVTSPYLCGFDRNTSDLVVLAYDGVCYRYSQVDTTAPIASITADGSKIENESTPATGDAVTTTQTSTTEPVKSLNYSLVETVRVIPRLN